MSVSFATALTGTLVASLTAVLAFGCDIHNNTLGRTAAPSQEDFGQLAHRGSGRFDPTMDSAAARSLDV